ncbi:MAG: 3' terminal RNA ribose 2'-O-methyltransferase Hen1 [Chloroflexota bacterium]
MYLSITTTHAPATDLGYLLHKHPARVQQFDLKFGQTHVFYPEATEERCTAAMLVDVDPVKLVRTQQRSPSFALQQYVNDRPYVASSFLSVAINNVYGTALAGRCKDRPELVETSIPLTAKLAAVPCRGGEALLRRLFEPLGYQVEAQRHVLDPHFPAWGQSRYFTIELSGVVTLKDLLTHIYVLAPVLDDDKHYWVAQDEVEKLLRFGEGWLASHPLRDQITSSYLVRQRGLTRAALAQLREETTTDQAEVDETQDAEEEKIEATAMQESADKNQPSLHQQRLTAVVTELKASGATKLLDLGCGEGKLLRMLLKEKQFTQIVGMDVSSASLDKAAQRLHLDRMSDTQRARIQLLQGSLLYHDSRLAGYDAVAAVEVIEHLEPDRLAAFARVMFEFINAPTVVITTPNREYNSQWASLPAGKLRHRDHRFEWTRAEFAAWAGDVANEFGYDVELHPLGAEIEGIGSPSQMGVFRHR